MGKIITPYDLRLKRAKAMSSEALISLTPNLGGWDAIVRGTRDYDVRVLIVDGELSRAACSCPDHRKMKDLWDWNWQNLDHDELAYALRGIPCINGVVVCKHILFVFLEAVKDEHVDTGWMVNAVWPSGKVSILGKTFWASEHGFSEANAKAADYVEYMQRCQMMGKPTIHGTVTPGTIVRMKRVHRDI